ncbi:15991_t:CDS:2, partial [Funneliformis caledonium]
INKIEDNNNNDESDSKEEQEEFEFLQNLYNSDKDINTSYNNSDINDDSVNKWQEKVNPEQYINFDILGYDDENEGA